MTQQRLGFKSQKRVKSQTNDYDRRNLESARIIVADPSQYGGCDSGLSQWARELVKRSDGQVEQVTATSEEVRPSPCQERLNYQRPSTQSLSESQEKASDTEMLRSPAGKITLPLPPITLRSGNELSKSEFERHEQVMSTGTSGGPHHVPPSPVLGSFPGAERLRVSRLHRFPRYRPQKVVSPSPHGPTYPGR